MTQFWLSCPLRTLACGPMAHFLRLILTALIVALVAPAPTSQAGTDPAVWTVATSEVAPIADPPVAVDTAPPAAQTPNSFGLTRLRAIESRPRRLHARAPTAQGPRQT